MILGQEHPNRNLKHHPPTLPPHIQSRWHYFSTIIDQALEAGLKPWPIAETACAAISKEWAL